MNEQRSIM